MARPKTRSTRSHVIELGLTVVAIVAIWVFLQVGGPSAVGQWLAPMFEPRP
jgi:hypothetical protein